MTRKKDLPHPPADLDFDEDLPKSKSQVKRDMEEMQELGKLLVTLNEKHLREVPLEEPLRDAIMQARVMKHREGYRRQLQFIGKLMRSADRDAIGATLERQQQKDAEQVHFLQQAENWRDRILAEGDAALNEFAGAHPGTDRQYLRQVLRAALKDRKEGKPPTNARKLFKYLRDFMSTEN